MIYDVAVVGGGITGLAFACKLAATQNISILILEANEPHYLVNDCNNYGRVSALNIASQQFLSSIGAWQCLNSNRINAYTHMQVWDGLHQGNIRFAHDDFGVAALGYIVENSALHAALLKTIQQHAVIQYVAPTRLNNMTITEDAVALTTDQTIWQARLVIGADGVQSQLRQLANIAVEKKEYDEKGIVATVTCEQNLHQTAYQVFLPDGPLAFLPLRSPNQSLASIVWSLPSMMANEMMQLDSNEFNSALTEASQHKLGNIMQSTGRQVFSLFRQQASHYVKPHIALLGDAAHVVHPLAGQGLNMGLADAANLSAMLIDVIKDGDDVYAYPVLRRYERLSKAEHAAWMLGIDRLHALFSSKQPFLQYGRSIGLNVAHRIKPLKRFFIKQGLGSFSL